MVGGRAEWSWEADLWNDSPWPFSVSEFLLGEVDSSTLLAVPPGDPSQVSNQQLTSRSTYLWEGVALSHRVGTWSQQCDSYLLGCVGLSEGSSRVLDIRKGRAEVPPEQKVIPHTVHGEPLWAWHRGAPTQRGGM